MSLNIDTSRAIRTPAERRALVHAIRDVRPGELEFDSAASSKDWDRGGDIAFNRARSRRPGEFGLRVGDATAIEPDRYGRLWRLRD